MVYPPTRLTSSWLPASGAGATKSPRACQEGRESGKVTPRPLTAGSPYAPTPDKLECQPASLGGARHRPPAAHCPAQHARGPDSGDVLRPVCGRPGLPARRHAPAGRFAGVAGLLHGPELYRLPAHPDQRAGDAAAERFAAFRDDGLVALPRLFPAHRLPGRRPQPDPADALLLDRRELPGARLHAPDAGGLPGPVARPRDRPRDRWPG